MYLTFKEFISISEGKNVGVIYHFTRWTSIENMVKYDFNLVSHQDYISFTRNYDLVNIKKFENDLAKQIYKEIPKKSCARIAIDGTKLSNKYKIQPFLDLEHGVQKKDNEAEERIKNEIVNIKDCIIQIDFLNINNEKIQKELKELIQNKYPKIDVNFVKTFKKVKI